MLEDLRWLGFAWQEGPDVGGPHAPYNQSARRAHYRAALEKLHAARLIFPCTRSRRDVLDAIGAPHEGAGADDEPVYPRDFRPPADAELPPLGRSSRSTGASACPMVRRWALSTGALARSRRVSGRDFGDSSSGGRTTCRATARVRVDDAEWR